MKPTIVLVHGAFAEATVEGSVETVGPIRNEVADAMGAKVVGVKSTS